MPIRFLPGFLSALALVVIPAIARDLPTHQDPRLIPVYQADRMWNAVATSRDGRVFAGFPASEEKPGAQVEEMTSKDTGRPYPDQAWNASRPGADPKSSFVHVNALRLGPDGQLYVVDAGSPGFGQPVTPGGARIIRIDLSTNRVSRIFLLDAGLKKKSYVDDIRFNDGRGYITDAGDPGLMILDLKSGAVRRVLDGVPAATDLRPMYADGRILKDKKGRDLKLHADQIEISPDGKYLYFQPASGPLARIEMKWLNDASLSAAALAGHVENWLDTPTSGGTAIDADGHIYMSDTNHRSIWKISADGKVSTLIADPRLIWSDAMWIDKDGFLWIPATQQNLTPGFDAGKSEIRYPVWIYKMQIHARPPANDHS